MRDITGAMVGIILIKDIFFNPATPITTIPIILSHMGTTTIHTSKDMNTVNTKVLGTRDPVDVVEVTGLAVIKAAVGGLAIVALEAGPTVVAATGEATVKP